MNIVLFGSTGLVGQEVVKILQTKSNVSVHLIGRRNLSAFDNSAFHFSDLNSLDELTNLLRDIKPDIALCCLGTTMKKAGSENEFYHVDHDLVINAGKASKIAGAKTFGVISSVGANTLSKIFYLKVKGETESDLEQLGLDHLIILRPGPLLGNRKEFRFNEFLLHKTAPLLQNLLKGSFKRYRPVQASAVASCLISYSLSSEEKCLLIENENIN